MSFAIAPNGAWLCPDTTPHTFDLPLAEGISEIFHMIAWANTQGVGSGKFRLLDLGCGSGQYVRYFRQQGFEAVGVDGNPKTLEFGEHCYIADLSKPVMVDPADFTVCLEVGEHVPQAFEQQLLDNVANLTKAWTVFSWFPRPGEGIGHVNERSNEWVIAQMAKRGFLHDAKFSDFLRFTAQNWWFKESLMVFQRDGI